MSSRRPPTTPVFYKQDDEAVQQMQSHMADTPPSHPSIALFKEGEFVHYIARFQMEGQDVETVAADLRTLIDAHCE
ncbi:BrxA/BrxB family bacilliredoxin [Streptosporangium oxazolinicum]